MVWIVHLHELQGILHCNCLVSVDFEGYGNYNHFYKMMFIDSLLNIYFKSLPLSLKIGDLRYVRMKLLNCYFAEKY